MDREPLTTPSATPSRDSITLANSHEPSSPVVISSSGSDSDEFKPHQMLMQTPITIECGSNLSEKLTMHEELLRCHSRLLEERFAAAKILRQRYQKANTLRNSIAALIFPEVNAEEFEAQNYQEKALHLIYTAYDQYPLPGYGNSIRKQIIQAVEEQVSLKNTKPRMLHNAMKETDWKTRITYIEPRGVYTITETLFRLLHYMNKKEIAKAEQDVVCAAAQKRILLPGVERETMESVMQWVYHARLECEDPQKLYDTLQLATKLGIEALSEFCHTRLYNAANDSMQNALNTGATLKSLLGYGPGPSDNVIGVIFKHALKDDDTPKRLEELVVNVLATSLDTGLWARLRDLVSHNIALHIVEAMLEHREQVATGIIGDAVIKSEDEQVRTVPSIHSADE